MDIGMEMVLAFKRLDFSYNMKKVNIFSLTEKDNIFKEINISKKSNGEISFSTLCSICGEYHVYNISLKSLIKKNVLILGCKVLGTPIIILGKKEEVENLVLHHNFVNYKSRAIF